MEFTKLTDAQLLEMSPEQLSAYALTVSTAIGLQYSTIASDLVVQAQYDYMILTSQSTITGLDYEITANDNAIIAADIRTAQIDAENAAIDSTIASYQTQITSFDKVISDSDRAITALTAESAQIDADIAKTDAEFISSATGYSSMYLTYMAKEILYQNCLSDISTTSSLYDVAAAEENFFLRNLEESTANVVARTAELSSLYLQGDQIQSSLSQYVIDETLANAALASTNIGIAAISSVYATALINQQYFQQTSTLRGIDDSLTAAQTAVTSARALAAAKPTDTVLAAAATMAQQRLTTLTTSKTSLTAEVTALQALVTDATAISLDTAISAAEAAIQLETINVSTFQGYADAASAEIVYYSTMFEQANVEIVSSLAAVELYSSLYNSSIAGSNALMLLVTQDTSSISGQQAEVDAISIAVNSLNIQYDQYVSSFNGWISYSSLMNKEIEKADADLILFSTLYESTSVVVKSLSNDLDQIQSSIVGNDSDIYTLSTILESEIVNMIAHQADVAASFNQEEYSAYQFRETYVRLRRADAQKYYDACIVQQVQNTSTQNATLKAQAGPSAFTPLPINLNTPAINLAYTNLTTITSFLDTFSNIYTNYNIQTTNLEGVSTSIGNQRTAYSTVTFFTKMTRLNPTNPNIGQSFSNAQTAFIANQTTTNNLMNNVALTQVQINAAKNRFLTTYHAVFLSSDIMANESTISSFLIAGFNGAATA